MDYEILETVFYYNQNNKLIGGKKTSHNINSIQKIFSVSPSILLQHVITSINSILVIDTPHSMKGNNIYSLSVVTCKVPQKVINQYRTDFIAYFSSLLLE